MSEIRLVKYDAARNALAAAVKVDEVKDIRDKAEAMEAYAAQAKDESLLVMATEIKARASRRAGEMLIEMAEQGKRRGIGQPKRNPALRDSIPPTLAEMGLSEKQSFQWRQIASIPTEKFEAIVAEAAETGSRLTTKALVAEAKRAAVPETSAKRSSSPAKAKPFNGPRVTTSPASESCGPPMEEVLSSLVDRVNSVVDILVEYGPETLALMLKSGKHGTHDTARVRDAISGLEKLLKSLED